MKFFATLGFATLVLAQTIFADDSTITEGADEAMNKSGYRDFGRYQGSRFGRYGGGLGGGFGGGLRRSYGSGLEGDLGDDYGSSFSNGYYTHGAGGYGDILAGRYRGGGRGSGGFRLGGRRQNGLRVPLSTYGDKLDGYGDAYGDAYGDDYGWDNDGHSIIDYVPGPDNHVYIQE